jgi:hypothetical protein
VAGECAKYAEAGRDDSCAALLQLLSPTVFAAVQNRDPKQDKSFSTLATDLARPIPPNCSLLTSPLPSERDKIDLLELRFRIKDHLTRRISLADFKELHEKVLHQFKRDSPAFAPGSPNSEALEELLQTLLRWEPVLGVDFALSIGEVLNEQKLFPNFRPLAQLVFQPTVFDDLTRPFTLSESNSDSGSDDEKDDGVRRSTRDRPQSAAQTRDLPVATDVLKQIKVLQTLFVIMAEEKGLRASEKKVAEEKEVADRRARQAAEEAARREEAAAKEKKAFFGRMGSSRQVSEPPKQAEAPPTRPERTDLERETAALEQEAFNPYSTNASILTNAQREGKQAGGDWIMCRMLGLPLFSKACAQSVLNLMIELGDDSSRIWSALTHRMFFMAVVVLKRYDQALVLATDLTKEWEKISFGFYFAKFTRSFIDLVIMPRFHSFLTRNFDGSKRPLKVVLGAMMSCLNVLYCAKFIPESLAAVLPSSMDRLMAVVEAGLNDPSEMKYVTEILHSVDAIRVRSGRSTALALQDRINTFTGVLQRFVQKHGSQANNNNRFD